MEDMKIEIIVRDKELYSAHGRPIYGSALSTAFDLRSMVDAQIDPGKVVAIDTGVNVWIGALISDYDGAPETEVGFTGMVFPRSGLGSKGLVLGNLTGIIDQDYQGPMICHLWNRNPDGAAFHIRRGDRIAQFAIVPILRPKFAIVEQFSDTTGRGEGGFGSTGVK